MCEVRLEKIVSSKPGNWVRCALAKLVISSLHILLFTPRYCFLIMKFPTVGLTDWSEHPSCAGQGGRRAG